MRRIIITLAACLLALAVALPANARKKKENKEETVAEMEVMELVDNVLGSYKEWSAVSWSGKIRSDKLPLSPSIRMYAERGKLLQISLRAPLIGEVGRIHITPDEVLAVNKWKKTYCRESAAQIMEMYPGLLDDLQSLFLGRMIIAGEGEFGMKTLESVDFIKAEGDEWAVVPKEMPADGKLQYGYVVKENGRTSLLYGSWAGRNENLILQYLYPDNSMDMVIRFHKGANVPDFVATIDFSSIKWGGTRMETPRLDKYRQMSVKDFIKNLK